MEPSQPQGAVSPEASPPRAAAGLKLDLARWSLLYLALPHALFLIGWLRWWIAASLTLLLAAAWLRRPAGSRTVTLGGVLFAAGAAFAVLIQSGVGGFGPQDMDWHKHNAVLMDLIRSPWPVVYEADGDRMALVYYVAYYLPAAVAGKLAGWRAANLALLAWTWIGLTGVLLWFQALVGKRAIAATALILVSMAFTRLSNLC